MEHSSGTDQIPLGIGRRRDIIGLMDVSISFDVSLLELWDHTAYCINTAFLC